MMSGRKPEAAVFLRMLNKRGSLTHPMMRSSCSVAMRAPRAFAQMTRPATTSPRVNHRAASGTKIPCGGLGSGVFCRLLLAAACVPAVLDPSLAGCASLPAVGLAAALPSPGESAEPLLVSSMASGFVTAVPSVSDEGSAIDTGSVAVVPAAPSTLTAVEGAAAAGASPAPVMSDAKCDLLSSSPVAASRSATAAIAEDAARLPTQCNASTSACVLPIDICRTRGMQSTNTAETYPSALVCRACGSHRPMSAGR